MNRYHSVLKILAVVSAVVLVFDGGYISPYSSQLSDYSYEYLASVGATMYARVEPNELNTITAELTRRENELNAREAGIAEREIAARPFTQGSPDISTYILSSILFILTVLITINYVLDWSRQRKLIYESAR